MKAKDWKKWKQENDPIKGRAIQCPDCGRHMGYDKDFMHMVIPEPGIVCPDCDEIVIPSVTVQMRA